jgi:UDP-N-acetylmuramoyl-tripeptide--D-alanyl-D-alanine ligase
MESVREMQGELVPNCLSICTDSRTYLSGQMFVAIVGERFDAFKFAESILKKDCPCMVLQYSEEKTHKVTELKKQYPSTLFIVCDDVELFLAELANRRIVEWKQQGGVVIGITGSNGKTTHKEMLYHLFNSVFPNKVMATKGNFNNHFGVPFTILAIKDSDQYAIIEMGSNHPGEIKALANISLPDAGIITNIGDSHLEFFLNRQNVFLEKRSLFDAISCSTSDKKLFVFNGEDPFLRTLEKYDWSLSFGGTGGDLATSYHPGKISVNGIELSNSNLVGRHNFMNLACCYILACRMIGHENKLEEAARTFVPGMNRSELLERGKSTLFLDAYNANPSSMEASIRALLDDKIFSSNESLFVLGDMNELGDSAESLHCQVGHFCSTIGISNIIFVGRYAARYRDGWGKDAQVFENTEELIKVWPDITANYSQIFIKGSRSLQLESLADIKYYNE